MASPASPPPADRAIAFLGLVLVTAGLFGAIAGISEGSRSSAPPPAVLVSSPTVSEAREALFAKVNDVLFRAEYRQALGATNAVLSLLMLVAGGMLLARRPSATWLAFNAVVAKALWTVADGASQATTLWSAQGELRQYFVTLQTASSGDGKAASPAMEPTLAVVTVVISTAIVLSFFLWVAWRLRRPDLRNIGS